MLITIVFEDGWWMVKDGQYVVDGFQEFDDAAAFALWYSPDSEGN